MRLTLEELFYGTKKQFKITRSVIRQGREERVQETLPIDMKPGWKSGTKITFQEKGDETPSTIAADIVFTLEQKPHPQFEREGNDLVKTVKIDLNEALLGTSFSVYTLDGKAMDVKIDDIISPDYVKVLPGEGMPVSKTPGTRGDMKLKFNIRFPSSLTDDARTPEVSSPNAPSKESRSRESASSLSAAASRSTRSSIARFSSRLPRYPGRSLRVQGIEPSSSYGYDPSVAARRGSGGGRSGRSRRSVERRASLSFSAAAKSPSPPRKSSPRSISSQSGW